MTDNGKKVLQSGIWYTISSIAIRAVAIITSPIYTAMLTTADYGIANTFNSWIEIFNIFTCLCVVYSIGRAKLDFGDRFDEYLSSLQGLSSSFAAIVLVFAVLFRKQISAWIGYEVPLVIVLFVYLTVFPSVEYMLQKCRYEYKYKQNILISLITCIGTVAFSILLMLLFNDRRYIGKIIGSILTTFLLGICFYVRLLKRGKKFFHKEYWIYALKFGLPMIPHALALVVLAQIDRIMIKSICGESDAGLYIYGYGFATLLMIFTNAIGQAWLPWFNQELHAEHREPIRRYQKKLVLLGVFLTIGFITVAPEALMILAPRGRAYWIAKWVVPPVALGALAQYFYTNYVNVELFHKKTPIIAVSSILAAALNFGLNWIFIPRFGYIAAAYTTFASYLFLMLFHFIATRFVLKEKVYADLFMFIAMGVTTAVCLAITRFYWNAVDGEESVSVVPGCPMMPVRYMPIMRYGLMFLTLGIFAIVKRHDIMLLFDYIKKRYLKKGAKT
ncbi:MAG: oligosaccharide flippase family protein [Lachnospiraceae bacterium]|nr:oligosaccharide flippase family protein [Lachnospiraceae bacterium]